MEADLRTLKERLAEISDLYRSLGVLSWDQKVMMPAGGHAARAEAMATLGRIAHERFVDAEVGRLLEGLRPLEESLDYDSDDASLIRVVAPRLGEAASCADRAAHRDDPRRARSATRSGSTRASAATSRASSRRSSTTSS